MTQVVVLRGRLSVGPADGSRIAGRISRCGVRGDGTAAREDRPSGCGLRKGAARGGSVFPCLESCLFLFFLVRATSWDTSTSGSIRHPADKILVPFLFLLQGL